MLGRQTAALIVGWGVVTRAGLYSLVCATVAAFALVVFWSDAARAASTTFEYPVSGSAGVYHEIPGTGMTFDASANERFYLRTRYLAVENVTPLESGDNIGNTFAIHCVDTATGAADGENGAYFGQNLVPDEDYDPTLGYAHTGAYIRWLFIAPSAGQYRCAIFVTSYSTIVEDGSEVTMRIPAGAELLRSQYPSSARWTLPSTSAKTVLAGQTLTTLGYTYILPSGVNGVTVLQDAQLTTCKDGSSICSGGSPWYDSSTVRTWVEAQPQTASGTSCGAVIKSPVIERTITTPRHHANATNSLYLSVADLNGCSRVRFSLKVWVTSGNPVLVHGGLSQASGIAAAGTHGLLVGYP